MFRSTKDVYIWERVNSNGVLNYSSGGRNDAPARITLNPTDGKVSITTQTAPEDATRKDYVDGKVTSDIKLKSNIVKVEHALDKVCALTGYTFDKIEWPLTNVQRKAGVIAQEVETVLPEAVGEAVGTDDTVKTVDPLALCGLLVEAIKELNEEIKVLKSKL